MIERWTLKVGYIDDLSASNIGSWRAWLLEKARRLGTADPAGRSSCCLTTAAGLGDWLAVLPYLDEYEGQIVDRVYALEPAARVSKDKAFCASFRGFFGVFCQLRQVLNWFLATKNRTLGEAAKVARMSRDGVADRVNELELTVEDFQGEGAVLGRLIHRSPVSRLLFDGLLSRKEWSDGPADTPGERRGQ